MLAAADDDAEMPIVDAEVQMAQSPAVPFSATTTVAQLDVKATAYLFVPYCSRYWRCCGVVWLSVLGIIHIIVY